MANDHMDGLRRALSRWLSRINGEVALERACRRCQVDPDAVTAAELPDIIKALKPSMKIYLGEAEAQSAVEQMLQDLARSAGTAS